MTVFLEVWPDEQEIEVRSRPTLDEVAGDARWTVRPGETFQGLTYEELRQLGSGRHEIKALDNSSPLA